MRQCFQLLQSGCVHCAQHSSRVCRAAHGCNVLRTHAALLALPRSAARRAPALAARRKRYSTGVLTLDNVLGGGIPSGRIVEIYGPESSGKTSLALCVLAEAQQLGERVAMIDAEHAFDAKYAKALGLNVDDLVFATPDTGEDALEVRRAPWLRLGGASVQFERGIISRYESC
jgi:predicted ATP-dependent serine protease